MEISLQGSSFNHIQYCSFNFPFLQPKSSLLFSGHNTNRIRFRSFGKLNLSLETSLVAFPIPQEKLVVSEFSLIEGISLLKLLETKPETIKLLETETEAETTKKVFKHMINTYNNGFKQDLGKRLVLKLLICGMLIDAREIFEYQVPEWGDYSETPEVDLVSWITTVSGLVELVEDLHAWHLIQKSGAPRWDPITFATMIRAAAGLEVVFAGRQLHSCALKMGFHEDNLVSGALIDMYSKCGHIEEAQTVFYAMPELNIAGWNNMIAAYSCHGYDEEALSLFYDMREFGLPTDHLTFLITTEIYTRLGYLELSFTTNSLVKLYQDWADTKDDRQVLGLTAQNKPRESWNRLLYGHEHFRQSDLAVKLFEEMLVQGQIPNHATFHAVLSACSKSLLLSDLGWEIFRSMTRDHKIRPCDKHFECMIELLGRGSHLREAFELVRSAPVKPSPRLWEALLTACRYNKNLELGKLAAEELYAFHRGKRSYYTVLFNIYKSSGMFEEAARILNHVLNWRGLRLLSPCSSIEIKKQSHVFFSGDKGHAQTEEIYQKVHELMLGHVDGEVTLLSDVDEYEQRTQKYHSERLAIAFGLINIADRRITVRITQDHRICNDCHNAVKLMSMATGRKIVVKDASRFHHFKDGECSCLGYW